MPIISDASQFNFDEYLKSISQSKAIDILETDNNSYIDFKMPGSTTGAFIPLLEMTSYVCEAEGSITLSETNGQIDLTYSLYPSEKVMKNESIIIGDDITIVVAEIRKGRVRLGIEAPSAVKVHRQEISDAIRRAAQQATQEQAIVG